MKKKILILGSNGMLGHIINLHLRSLNDFFTVTDVARESHFLKPDVQLDVTNFAELLKLYNRLKPDIIINCVGVLNSKAENCPANAVLINSYLPHFLEKITETQFCRVIHISTDCVFSGGRGDYSENDFTDADNYYGRTKSLGEIKNDKDLTIRTSIIGPELRTNGIGLFHWFSIQSGVIQGYSEVFWTGLTTIELSTAIVHCIQSDVTGLYHIVNDSKISKYDLLNIFKSVFSKSAVTLIKPCSLYRYDKSLINTRSDLDYKVPSYQVMIENMKSWILNYKEIYPQYQSIV